LPDSVLEVGCTVKGCGESGAWKDWNEVEMGAEVLKILGEDVNGAGEFGN
jgi:hypothetical protein